MERESCELCCKVMMVQVITAGSGLDQYHLLVAWTDDATRRPRALMSSIRLGQLFFLHCAYFSVFGCSGYLAFALVSWL